MTSSHLETAVRALRTGGVIAYPTEGVYGLGCDPTNQQAVQRLLALKERSLDKGVILIAADLDQLLPWLSLDETERRRLAAPWPEATTYLVRAASGVPEWIRGKHPAVGVRVTGHPVAAELCRRFGGPLVSTSANLSGRPAARNRFQVARIFGDRLDFLVAGNCGARGRPSTIIDFHTGDVLRS